MNIRFIASVSVVARDPVESRKLYVDTLGLPLEQLDGDYYASEHVEGSKHFGVWPLSEVAQACFGTSGWPADTPVPQVSLEFELKDADAVAAGATELQEAGYSLLHPARTEPWGQTVARILSPEGAIVGLSFAPWLQEQEEVQQA
jgi:catechol 2,3-dioxygenase-like lactoylglutathione lyase family enzyme